MKAIRLINQYFFGEDHICWSDAFYFYGISFFILMVGVNYLIKLIII
ncbi:hypothetical protein [Paraliobacillus ryukyuensis]|nr:hypothetical protein [Paraliobacillus ryukyuensis]